LRLSLTHPCLLSPRFLLYGCGMPLFQCSQEPAATGSKRRKGEEGEGGTGHGLTQDQVEELAVRTAQLVSLHDISIREMGTLWRRVKMPLKGRYGKEFMKVHVEWKGKRGGGENTGGSKHLRLGVVALEQLYEWEGLKPEVKETLCKRWEGKDTNTPAFLGTDVRCMKWQPLKNGTEGILTYGLVPALAAVEEELTRLLATQASAEELVGMAPKGPQVRGMEELIEGTWRREGK